MVLAAPVSRVRRNKFTSISGRPSGAFGIIQELRRRRRGVVHGSKRKGMPRLSRAELMRKRQLSLPKRPRTVSDIFGMKGPDVKKVVTV